MSGQRCTDEMRSVDVRWMKREGLLVTGRAGSITWSSRGKTVGEIGYSVLTDRVRFNYRNSAYGGPWADVQADAVLTYTACHMGGQRVWWSCPHCERRVAILYLGRIMACRQCWGLAYRSERETGYDRTARRANRIRSQLGWEPGILNGHGSKPKGMHWQTFERLVARHDEDVTASLQGMLASLRRT